MRVFPNDPLRRNAVLAAFVGVSALYFFHAHVHRPRLERAEALAARIDRWASLHPGLDARRGARDRASGLETYAAHLARLETLIPASDEVSALLEAISVAERRTGVEIMLLSPEPRREDEAYEHWSYETVARGGYHEIASFLTAIASLDRIMIPSDVDMAAELASPAEPASRTERIGTGTSLVANFRIRTYVRREPRVPDASISPAWIKDSIRP